MSSPSEENKSADEGKSEGAEPITIRVRDQVRVASIWQQVTERD